MDSLINDIEKEIDRIKEDIITISWNVLNEGLDPVTQIFDGNPIRLRRTEEKILEKLEYYENLFKVSKEFGDTEKFKVILERLKRIK